MSDDPVIHEAIKLRNRLRDCAREFGFIAKAAKSDAARHCALIDEKSCIEAADMLEKLGTEVTRLRLGIGHLYYGHMDRHELSRMTRTWNGDKPHAPPAGVPDND